MMFLLFIIFFNKDEYVIQLHVRQHEVRNKKLCNKSQGEHEEERRCAISEEGK